MPHSIPSRWRIVREAFRDYFWDESRLLLVLLGLFVLAVGLLVYFGVFTRAEPYAYYLFGRSQEVLKGPGDPDDSYTQALGMKPAWGEGYYRRGLWRSEHRDPELALKDLEMGAEFLEDPGKALRAHAALCAKLGRQDQAAWDFRQAIGKSPQDGRNYLARADWEMGLHQLEDALGDYQKALQLSPELVDARIGVEEAKRAIEQAKLRRQLNGE